MNTSSLILYHHGSSACAAKVRFALAEKQLPWEGRYIDILKGEQFSPEYLAVNPKAVVPALVHDGHVITESTLICEYAEETFPQHPLYPATPLQRVEARYWTKAVDEELHPACSAITYVVSHRHTILRNGVGSFDEFLKAGAGEGRAARQLKWQWIQDGIKAPGAADKIKLYFSYLDKMEATLADREWLLGDRLSIADVAMAPYVNRLAALAMSGVWENGRLPRVTDWFVRLRQRPTFNAAFIEWMPQALSDEMYRNGLQSWPDVKALLEANQ
ncbi:MAG TPA: glutathione S-transferase family protein [Candidatus Acidoferrum sp.]|nr:glutathione S-transferase family protein [Candidatus Acidoferrum sp.]